MILSTNSELRLHLPSNAVDEVALLQGILDNSEKDFLKDKLGAGLYDKLCEYYLTISPEDFAYKVTTGAYSSDAWAELLLNAQRMVANDAMARYIYQQAISVNSAGVNVASTNDYEAADSKYLDKGATAFRKEAMVALNNLLILLEDWAQATEPTDDQTKIVSLWQQSKYFYNHADLLIPTCAALQHYIDIYDSRDKFVRLLPDLHFVQEEYVVDFVGEDVLSELKTSDDAADKKIMRKLLRMLVARLEERTSVLTIDKARRAQAHDEATSLQQSLLLLLKARKEKKEAEEHPDVAPPSDADSADGYKNNLPGSRMFVSPLIY